MSSEALTASLFSWVDNGGNTNVLDVDVVMASTDKRGAKLTDHVVEDGSVVTDHVIILPEQLSLELLVTQTPIQGVRTLDGAGTFALDSIDVSASGQALVSKTYPLTIPPSQFVPGGFLFLTQGAQTLVASGVSALLGVIGVAGAGAPSLSGSDLVQTNTTVKAAVLQSNNPIDRVGLVHDQLIQIYESALLVTTSFKGRLYVDYLITELELKNQAGEFGMGRFHVSLRAFRTVTGTAASVPDPADFRALPNVNTGSANSKVPFGPPPPPPELESHAHQGVSFVNPFLYGVKGS